MNHTTDQTKALVAAAFTQTYHYSVYDENGIPYIAEDGQVLFTRTSADLFACTLQVKGLHAEARDVRDIPAIKRQPLPTIKESLKALWYALWPLLVFFAVTLPIAMYWIASSKG